MKNAAPFIMRHAAWSTSVANHPAVELSASFDTVAPALSGHFVQSFSSPLVAFGQRGRYAFVRWMEKEISSGGGPRDAAS